MNGIQYIVNEKGEKTAVLVDLKKYRQEWEDFYDSLIAKSRKNEKRISLKEVKKNLLKKGKFNE